MREKYYLLAKKVWLISQANGANLPAAVGKRWTASAVEPSRNKLSPLVTIMIIAGRSAEAVADRGQIGGGIAGVITSMLLGIRAGVRST